jgi:hypothetical protein
MNNSENSHLNIPQATKQVYFELKKYMPSDLVNIVENYSDFLDHPVYQSVLIDKYTFNECKKNKYFIRQDIEHIYFENILNYLTLSPMFFSYIKPTRVKNMVNEEKNWSNQRQLYIDLHSNNIQANLIHANEERFAINYDNDAWMISNKPIEDTHIHELFHLWGCLVCKICKHSYHKTHEICTTYVTCDEETYTLYDNKKKIYLTFPYEQDFN